MSKDQEPIEIHAKNNFQSPEKINLLSMSFASSLRVMQGKELAMVGSASNLSVGSFEFIVEFGAWFLDVSTLIVIIAMPV